MNELTQDQVRSLFDYREGNLYWKVSKGSRAQIGDLAGYVNKRGYRQIRINGKLYYTHRLIFLYHHGYLPEFLDHIDCNKLNDNIENIRVATRSQNQWNQRSHKSYCGKPTLSKYKGVYLNKERGKWYTQIRIKGKSKHLGYFTSEIKAAEGYNKAAIKYHGEYARLNIIDKASNGIDGFDSHTMNAERRNKQNGGNNNE